MIERLLEFSVRRRSLVLLLAAAFVLLGAAAARRVPIDAVPDVTDAQVKILTSAPSLGAEDVETYLTHPIEHAMAGLPDVEEIRSISRAGISVVTVVFSEDTELYRARQLVGERLPQARERIPAGLGSPEMAPPTSGLGEVYHFEVRGEGHSLMELRTVLDYQVAPRLRMVPGVVDVNVFGGELRTWEISLDPARCAAHGVGATEVREAFERNHGSGGGAYLHDGSEHTVVRVDARVRTLAELGEVPVVARGGAAVRVRDLGEVREAPHVRYGAVTRDGNREAVVGVAMMRAGADSGSVVAGVRGAIEDLSRSLPAGVRIETYYDRRTLVDRTIRTVVTNLLEAGALVVFVLFLTLGSGRAGLVVAAAIPLALLGVFTGMWAAKVPGNLLSLGAIDFGLVVDGAIIVVENAQRLLSERAHALGRALTRRERQDAVLDAAKEVRSATAFGEAIIALVYVPLLALEGVEGRMFRPMALAVLFALGAAFVLSLTVVPALASLALSRAQSHDESFFVRALARAYAPGLHLALRVPRVTLALAVAAVVVGVVVSTRLGRSFMPKLDEGSLVITMVRLPSASLEHSTRQTRQVETILREFPEVTTVVSRTGRAEIALDPMGMNMTDVYVMLQPRAQWRTAHDQEGLVTAFEHALSTRVPGVGFAFTQPIEMNTNDLLAGISSDLALHVYGDDLTALRQTAQRALELLRAIPGARDVRLEQIAGSSALDVRLDRAAASRVGVEAQSVIDTIAAVGGLEAGVVLDGTRRVPVQIRWSEASRRDERAVRALPLRAPLGSEASVLPLESVATVRVVPSPAQVSRERLQRRTTIELNVRGRDVGTFVHEANGVLNARLRLPTGYTTAWAGEYERLQHAAERLFLIIPAALALIAVLLIATFGRVRPALMIFGNVPVGVSGGVLALAARGLPLSISAGVGFIALFGVAVLNGLVLLSLAETLRKGGLTAHDAVERAARLRMRAVVTTALVASLGFLPMALSHGAGAEVQRPLATVVIGGLLSSTLLTLFVLPAAYARFGGRPGDEDEHTPATPPAEPAAGAAP